MPFPAMKQTVTITRESEDRGGWGSGKSTETFDVKCRVDEKTQVVKNQFGEETVTTAEIIMWKLVDVRYSDTITFRNELGVEIERKPVRIEPLRWFNGKPRYTVVYI